MIIAEIEFPREKMASHKSDDFTEKRDILVFLSDSVSMSGNKFIQ